MKEFTNELDQLYSVVSEDAGYRYIYLQWFGNHVTVADLQKVAEYEFERCEKFNITAIINDNSQLTGSWDHTLEWNVSIWLPRALALGINRLAMIISQDIFEQLSAAEVKQSFEGSIETHFFKDLKSAQQWITEAIM